MDTYRAHKGHVLILGCLMIGMVAAITPAPSPMEAQEADAEVQIVDFAFEAATIEIPAGTTVVWTNSGSAPHTVTSDTGAFDSGRLDPGETFSMTFDTPGTYTYHCEFHPEMQGTIVVTEAAASEATAETTGDGTQEASADDTVHLAHIHAGTCEELGIVVYSLASIQSTQVPAAGSDTEMVETIIGTADVNLADLFDEPFSVHIHESEQNKQNYVGCADIGGQPEAPWSPEDGLELEVVEQSESGHTGFASLRPDTGGATTVTIVLVAASADDQQQAQAESPPPGTTYTSPTYGYTMTYGQAWTVEVESSTDGTDLLILTNGTSFVTASGMAAYDGDPDRCVEGVVEERLADPAVSNIVLATDERGQPIQGGTEATGSFAIYDHDYTFENGVTEPWTLYVQCIPLVPGEAVVAFAHNVPSESYVGEVGARQTLLRGLTLPQ